MKNIKHDLDDSLRPEYQPSDFGEMVRGKHATTHIEFAELVRLLLACIGEDESLSFVNDSATNQLRVHKTGDWTYTIDDANQITLRYWTTELDSIEETISNPCCITTPQDRVELQNVLLNDVRKLKAKADSL